MNRGTIPGFYYGKTIDEEKKKYFKILANHRVPPNAKYSQSSVQQDKREPKKRKLEDRRRQQVRTQTVQRSRILCEPIVTGIGLEREHGTSPTTSPTRRDAAIVSRLVFRRRELAFDGPFRVTQMQRCAGGTDVAIALRHSDLDAQGRNSHMLHTLPSRFLDQEQEKDALSFNESLTHDGSAPPLLAFGSPITSISTVMIGDRILLFACALERVSPGNVASVTLTPSPWPGPPRGNLGLEQLRGFQRPDDFSHASNLGTLGTSISTSLWQTSINSDKDTVAVAGTLGVWTLDLSCTLKDRLSITRRDYADPEDDETRAVDWLDHHTVAAGSEQIYLWDQRSGGASQRFRCKGRVTGIVNPERPASGVTTGGGRGQRLLISTNRSINLFDVRYISQSKPVLAWKHEHEGPQISLTSAASTGTIPGSDLFAAADRSYYVQVYSMRTGGQVARLGGSGRGKGIVSNLRWCEDLAGRPGLRALHAGDMLEWSWSGSNDIV